MYITLTQGKSNIKQLKKDVSTRQWSPGPNAVDSTGIQEQQRKPKSGSPQWVATFMVIFFLTRSCSFLKFVLVLLLALFPHLTLGPPYQECSVFLLQVLSSDLIKFKPLCFSGFPPPHIVTWKQTCSRTKTRKHLITSFVPPHNKIRCLMKSHTVEGGCLARGYTIALFFILVSY